MLHRQGALDAVLRCRRDRLTLAAADVLSIMAIMAIMAAQGCAYAALVL
jgi:hypothetical protein